MINPDWTGKGKTVTQLIRELQTFENQEMEVRISLDDGITSFPISLVGKSNDKYVVLKNSQDVPTAIRHRPRDA